MSKFILHILTGPDNATFEPANAIAVFGALVGVGLSAYGYVARSQMFDLQAYGVGLGIIVGSLGAAQKLRGDAR